MTEEDVALTTMVQKMGERVAGMRGLPELPGYRHWHIPGDHSRACEDGSTLHWTVTESKHWPKIDKIILKALKAMLAKGTQGALGKLQEAAFVAAFGGPKPGFDHLAVRLIDTRHKVEEYGRLRRVAAGKEEADDEDAILYAQKDVIEAHAIVLRKRGILQPKKKQQQEQE